ncbi:T9SS type A sorting domain-containing protein [Pedobacter sp. P351]|uniref:T9SS type A sorting domain-containing protein n=1 Tax=Pedobacter superstes TaxID=3133441 RepID=UPI0030A4C586
MNLTITQQVKKTILFCTSLLFSGAAFSQLPEAKVDFNMHGRPSAEVQEPGYTPWVLKNGLLDSISVNGLKFIVKKGPRGLNMSGTYFKASVQAGAFNARFTNDGIFVKDGDFALGSQIDLIIKGLPAGEHTLVTYHNIPDNVAVAAVCPLDVYVNNILTVENLIPTVRLEKMTECATSEIQVNVEAGQQVVISYRAKTTGSQPVKNVYINGFQLNGVNAGKKSRSPHPAHGEEHLDVPIGGSLELSWEKSPTALSHDVYFGTDSILVANADRSSTFFMGNQPANITTYTATNLYTMDKYYWRVDEVGSQALYKGNVWHFRTRQLAFPDAEGYGRFARGGRGGKVIEVTNLNDSGAGSLRAAVENNIGPRTIVFSVSGIIQLQSRLVLKDPYVTVAGQTAPGKGICIRSSPFGITGNDCIVRHVRVRLGGGRTFDGMGLTGANHSIMDHCSISWTIDEAFSSRGAKNITLQRTLISEALNQAGHQNYPAGNRHGYAATIGGDRGSFHHNLLAHNEGRNWSLGGGLDGNGYYSGELDIANNVVYNWGGRTTDGGAKEVNFTNNYYKPGPATRHFYAFTLNHEGVGKGTQRCYFNGNVMPGRFNENNQMLGRRSVNSNGDTSSYQTFVSAPFFTSYVVTESAYKAYKNVLSDVGCTQPVFDDHDIRIVNETRDSTYTYVGSKTGFKGLPDDQADVGGYEDYPEVRRDSDWDSDHDGMPDWWENLKGFNPHSSPGDFSEGNADPDRDGNTPLEEYLEWMSTPHYSTKGMEPILIDLSNLARGYKISPKFTVSGAVNGTISVNDSIARFKPSKLGLGSFYFTVTDSEGASMARKINMLSGDFTHKASSLTFEATRLNPQNVNLTWETKYEANNESFQIERSFSDVNHFAKLGKSILSKGKNGAAASFTYNVNDKNDYLGNTYYRVVTKDRDGTLTTSDIRVVSGMRNAVLNVWPVPNDGNFNVQLINVNYNCVLEIYDMSGKLIKTQNMENSVAVPVQLTTTGIYILKVSSIADSVVLFNRKIEVQ